jgi:hypothetical protein
MAFGEVDFGGGDGGASAASQGIGLARSDRPAPATPASRPPAAPGAEGPTSWAPPPPAASSAATVGPHPAVRPRRTVGRIIAFGVLAAITVAGAALQLTPHGAFGYLFVTDLLRAGDYAKATAAAVHDAEAALAMDTYDGAKHAVEIAAAAHGKVSRARDLTAYAAFVEYAVTIRFGPDDARVSQGKALLAELPPEPASHLRDLAVATQLAAAGEVATARAALERVSHALGHDPLRVDVALLLGDLALAAGDGAAALTSFQSAIEAADDARGHYGLARANALLGDGTSAAKEVAATLAASPQHPGAITMRVRRSGTVDAARAS